MSSGDRKEHPQQAPPYLGVYDGFLPLAHDTFSSLTKCGGTAVLHPRALVGDAGAAVQSQIAELTRCRACRGPMYLLAQTFAPLPSVPVGAPHNRMLYVFACNSSECAAKPSDSWVAMSVQLDEDDDDAINANDEEENDEPIPVDATPRALLPNQDSFPPIAVDISEEPKKEAIVPTEVESELIREAASAAAGPATDDDIRELEDQLDLKDKAIDVYFDKFRRRIARCPRQVLRYQRGGLPLYMNLNKVLDLTVPACEHCGGARAMELQLLPTLLYFLRSKSYVPRGKKSGDDGTDFATATVFTCASGCLGTRTGLVLQREFLFVEPAPTIAEEVSPDGRPSLHSYFKASAADE